MEEQQADHRLERMNFIIAADLSNLIPLAEEISREVIREKPQHVYSHLAIYLEALLKTQQIADAVEENLLRSKNDVSESQENDIQSPTNEISPCQDADRNLNEEESGDYTIMQENDIQPTNEISPCHDADRTLDEKEFYSGEYTIMQHFQSGIENSAESSPLRQASLTEEQAAIKIQRFFRASFSKSRELLEQETIYPERDENLEEVKIENNVNGEIIEECQSPIASNILNYINNSESSTPTSRNSNLLTRKSYSGYFKRAFSVDDEKLRRHTWTESFQDKQKTSQLQPYESTSAFLDQISYNNTALSPPPNSPKMCTYRASKSQENIRSQSQVPSTTRLSISEQKNQKYYRSVPPVTKQPKSRIECLSDCITVTSMKPAPLPAVRTHSNIAGNSAVVLLGGPTSTFGKTATPIRNFVLPAIQILKEEWIEPYNPASTEPIQKNSRRSSQLDVQNKGNPKKQNRNSTPTSSRKLSSVSRHSQQN